MQPAPTNPEKSTKRPSFSEVTDSPYNTPVFREARMKFMYGFLLEKTVKQLRKICKPFKLVVSKRSQSQLIAEIILYLHTQSLEDISIRCCVSINDELKSFFSYEEQCVSRGELLTTLPDVGTFFNLAHPSDRKSAINAIKHFQYGAPSSPQFPLTLEEEVDVKDPAFCLNEFGRLMVVLRDDEQAKTALLNAYGRVLSRAELDAKTSRDSYWLIIASRFNDNQVDSKESFSGKLEEVDSNQRPLCTRSSSVLKQQFDSIRSLATKARANWSKSGQNDPTNFTSFLRRTPGGQLTAAAKRAYVFFIVSRIGTSNEVVHLTTTASRLIEEEDGGVEEGRLGSMDQREAFKSGVSTRSARSSGNYKDVGDLSKVVTQSNQISREQTAIFKEHLELEREKFRGPKKSAIEEQEDYFTHRVKLGSLLAESSTSLKRARDLNDDALVNVLEENHTQLLKKYKHVIQNDME